MRILISDCRRGTRWIFCGGVTCKGGVKVALFDGRPEGEPKACGGGVTAKALKAWPQLLNAVGRTISELDLYSPSVNDFTWRSKSLRDLFAHRVRLLLTRARARRRRAHHPGKNLGAESKESRLGLAREK